MATETEILEETKTAIAEPWKVLLHNDPVNLMGYVVLMLKNIFGYSDEKASEIMLSVHKNGKTVVWSGEKETAEFYVEQLHSAQLMATIENTGASS